MTERTVCVSCSHEIDAAAKLCPYCGADPRTGQRVVDTQALLEEEFHPRKVTTSESVLEYARQRQGVVITVAIFVGVIILAALHQYVTHRNESAVSNAPAVALTEVTDLSSQPEESKQPMPDLKFQYDGHPETMRTFITEPGAVTPPEVVAAQQQQQQQQQPPQSLAAKPQQH